MRITPHTVVTVHYSLSEPDGHVVDSSSESGPLTYVQGRDEVFPGLAAALEGKRAGDTVSFSVGPDEGFGERDPARVVTMPRDRFEADVREGQIVLARTGPGPGPGATTPFLVLAVDGDRVIVDGNHPLAGKTVTFTVTVLDVRPPGGDEAKPGSLLQ